MPEAGTQRPSLSPQDYLPRGRRPDKSVLANAQHAAQWTVRRHPEAGLYQFVGYVSPSADRTSIIIATVLAIDPKAGWALLTNDRWMTLGRRLPETAVFNPIEVTRGAAAWLGSGAQTDA